MKTVSYFTHKGRKMHIYKAYGLGPKGQVFCRAPVDGEDLPVNWPNAAELEMAIKKVLDQD